MGTFYEVIHGKMVPRSEREVVARIQRLSMGRANDIGEKLVDVQRARGGVALPRGYDGIPKLNAESLIRPKRFTMIESAISFIPRTFPRPVYVWCNSSVRIIRAVPDELTDTAANIIANGEFFSSVQGFFRIPTAGKWQLNTPIVNAEGTQVDFLYADSLGDVGADPASVIGSAALSPYDLKSINGIIQTGFDWVGQRLVPPTWGTPAVVAVANGADTAVLAANNNRRALNVFNNSAAGGAQIALTTENPATAFRGFIILPPKFGYVWNPPDAVTRQIIRGWADAAASSLIVNEGT